MPAGRSSDLPRVLYAAQIDASRKFGSFEEQTLSLGRALRERSGVFVPVFPTPLGPRASEAFRAAGLGAECLDLGRFRPSTLAALVRLIRRDRIEVVHWNFYEPVRNGYVWALGLAAPRVRQLYTDHNSRPGGTSGQGGRRAGAIKAMAFRRFERVFCVSDFVADRLQAGGRWANVVRWTHRVNTERFSPDPAVRREVRAREGCAERFVALVVAHLVPEKGVDVAIRSMPLLPESAVLWVVGDGPERAGLEGLTRRLSLGDRVRFFGEQWDVAPFMRAADVLVCPSLWAEAAGLVNLEALACGLPVVASRTGGIPEYVEDGSTGVLVPPGDAGALAGAIAALASDAAARDDMAGAAREAALARFSLADGIDEYLDLYRPRAGAGARDHADVAGATA
jgi:glycosyltransferase involved in cell wall biosynthesis